MKKITKATLKSFIKNNKDLYIDTKTRFDGRTDGIESVKDGFKKAEKTERAMNNTLGINGVWVVGGRDWFNRYEDGRFTGIEVSNCCGCFVVATPK